MIWTKFIGPVILFVLAFFLARVASRPSGSGRPDETAIVSSEKAGAQSLLPTRAPANGATTGFAAMVASLSAKESAYQKNNIEVLNDSDHSTNATYEMAKTDPVGLWRGIKEGRYTVAGSNLYLILFDNWFRRDPDEALAALQQAGETARHSGTFAILYLIFDEDLKVARAAGESIHKIIGTARPAPGEPGEYHFKQGLETVERLEALPDSHVKDDLIGLALVGWCLRDWKAARDWIEARPEEERAKREQALFSRGLPYALKNDAEAVDWVVEWLGREENRDQRARLGSDIAYAMARRDPARAMTWASENLGGATLASALGSVVTNQFKSDRVAAIETVDALPPGGVRLRAGRALIHAMMVKEPLAAYERALIDERAGFKFGSRGWGRMGSTLAGKDPDLARRILAEPPEAVPATFEQSALDRLASKDPEAMMRWAADLGGERGATLREQVLRRWRVREPVLAEKWARENPD